MKMEIIYKMIILIFMIVIVPIFATSFDVNDSSVEEINGEYIMRMGSLVNNPVLSLVGAAINNLHKCGEWTQWSTCTASRPNHFGIKKRSRQCSIERRKTTKTEEELTVCKGTCPSDYEITKSSFCLKLYPLTESQTNAQKQCKTDGGSLVKIDTEDKYDDVKTLKGITSAGYIYIDGVRKDTESAWVFTTQSKTIFFKWAKNEPDNGSTQLCLVIRGSDKLMFDAVCHSLRRFICEIKM